MKVVCTEVMRSLDAATIAAGIPGDVLMERAGRGSFAALEEYLKLLPECHRKRILVLAGKGNNGGDGFVVARLAAEAGYQVCIDSVCGIDGLTGDCLTHAQRMPSTVEWEDCDGSLPSHHLQAGTVVVDALLGTGIKGHLRQPYSDWIARVNESQLSVVALDIPSGLNGDTGQCAGDAIIADLTVTMGLPKSGLFRGEGLLRSGRLRCVDIGLLPGLVEEAAADFETVTAEDVRPLLGRRPAAGHKGTFGRVLTIGGASEYTGAPILAAEAALRAGAGLSTVVLPQSILGRHDRGTRALIVRGANDSGTGVLSGACMADLRTFADQTDALVAGPGLTRAPGVGQLVGELLAWDCPKVLDADALIALSREKALLGGKRGETVLTPHPGEMLALLEGFDLKHLAGEERSEQALQLAGKTGCYVVLKGRGTVLAAPDGRWAVNSSGGSALATGGTGDVLAGLMGGFLGQGLPVWDAIRLAVFVHGRAGELSLVGDRALIADDLLTLIGPAMRLISPLS